MLKPVEWLVGPWVALMKAKFLGRFAAKETVYTVENIVGFYVRGTSTISKGTYTRTIQSLASLTEGTSIPKLLKFLKQKREQVELIK